MEAITDGRYFSTRSRPFQLGMTMLAAFVLGRVEACVAPCARIRWSRSQKSKETATAAKSTGEMSASGRPLRIRHSAANLRPFAASATLVELRAQVQGAAQ